jgi:hypothetical protein
MVVGQHKSLALRSAFCALRTIHLTYIELDPLCSPCFASCDSLPDQQFSVLVLMHPLQMLFEIVKPRPLLLMPGAAFSETLILLTVAMFWLNLVNTLLMSLEIVDGREALRSCTPLLSTYVHSVVPSCMLSKNNGQQCSLPTGPGQDILEVGLGLAPVSTTFILTR